MTLRVPHAIDGATYTSDQIRMMQQAAALGAEGIIDVADLIVRPRATPGTGVRIGRGQALVRGRDGLDPGDTSGQGTYAVYNDAHVDVPLTGTDGAGARQDLLILRVEDPTWPGAGWDHDPETDPMVYPYVIQGVPAGTATIPAEYRWSAIPLARIEWPSNTATVTAGMIKTVRWVANPKSLLVKRVQRGITPIDYAGNIQAPDWENWPDLVWPDVTIPSWATQVQVDAIWGQAGFFPGDKAGGSGSTDARGRVRVALGPGAQTIYTGTSAYNENEDPNNGKRVAIFNFDQIPIPAALRGITTNLRMQVSGEAGVRGRLRADGAANFRVDLLFQEVAIEDVDE